MATACLLIVVIGLAARSLGQPSAAAMVVAETPAALVFDPTSSLLPSLTPTTRNPSQTISTPTPLPEPSATPTPVHTTIVATGDVLLGRMVRTESERNGAYSWPFVATRDLLVDADITLINFEGTFFEPCPPAYVTYVFCAPEAAIEGLTYAGVDIANLANNHILDKNEEGYESTIRVLQDAGIRPSDSTHLAIIDRDGVRFGFIGFNLIWQFPHMTILSNDEIAARIAEVDPTVDVLVVSFHWGEEYDEVVRQDQIDLAYRAVEAGADLIVGTHPHIIQRTEVYQDTLILYSLGNFVFDNMTGTYARHGEVAVIAFEGDRFQSYEMIPITIYDYGQPRIDEAAE